MITDCFAHTVKISQEVLQFHARLRAQDSGPCFPNLVEHIHSYGLQLSSSLQQCADRSAVRAGAMLVPPAELLMTEGSPDSPPQPVTTLYVGNLPPGVDEQILFQTFRVFGHIPDIQV